MTGRTLRDFYEDPLVPARSGADRARRQAEMLAALLPGLPSPARVLDIGCGDGFATEISARIAAGGTAGGTVRRESGPRILGLDWSATSLRAARRRGLTVARASLEQAGLPIGSDLIDVVILGEVIEHLADTDAAIEEIRRVLRPGGSLLVSTPNLAAWYNRALLAAGIQPVFSEVSLRSVFGRPGSQVAGHLRMFTRRALVEFLAAYGLVTVRVTGASYHDLPGPLRPLDRAFCRWPAAASILLVHARKR
ncbi:MAG: class I SAM-dependent methyltransferase [Actinomycetota bacterium]|jgi:SAM-dependent methyltransferase|nr:class I SAM-dependent methyltransferase [Actinomycetota bacterium]